MKIYITRQKVIVLNLPPVYEAISLYDPLPVPSPFGELVATRALARFHEQADKKFLRLVARSENSQ